MVGKMGFGFGLHFLWICNTLLVSTVQINGASLASVEVTVTFKNRRHMNSLDTVAPSTKIGEKRSLSLKRRRKII